MGKIKRLFQSNILREQGIPANGTLVNPPHKGINPIGFYNPDKSKYNLIWTNYDFNQCCSRYVWENLPNELSSWNIERMLYFRGTLAGFLYKENFYILPYVMQGGINNYGFPTRIKPITYNGDNIDDTFELPVDLVGDANERYDAVLLYDALPYSTSGQSPSRYALNQIIINEICDTFARVNINIVVSNKKIFIKTKDPKQADIIRKELEIAFDSDCPFAIITDEFDTETIQNSNDFNADDLFNTIKNYDAIRCFMSGISSKGFGAEKKERLVTGELAGAEEEKDLILDMGYDLRKEFADRCNAKFGTNIKVYKRSDFYKEKASTEVNGLGMTAEEEVETW